MDSLLKHMVDMTGHRDHTMLDISVISAVAELASATQARVLSIVNVRGQLYVRARAVIEQGRPARMEEYLDPAIPGDPVSMFPALARCLAHHEASADYMSPEGEHTLWLPIWMGDKADTCLEIVNPTPYTSDTIHIIGGIVSVYRNFQNLLDYSERDSLTGLLNRKTFDDQLSKMLQARPSTTCWLCRRTASNGAIRRNRKSNGWPWSTSTTSRRSMTSSGICMAMRC